MVQVVHRLGNVLPIPRRRLLFALLTLTLLGAAGAASHYAGRNLWARHHYRAATEALESSDLAAARTHLLLCLEVWSNSAETHLQAARTFRRLEEYEEAENQLQACEQREEVAEAVQMERILTQAQRGDLIGVESYLVAAV